MGSHPKVTLSCHTLEYLSFISRDTIRICRNFISFFSNSNKGVVLVQCERLMIGVRFNLYFPKFQNNILDIERSYFLILTLKWC